MPRPTKELQKEYQREWIAKRRSDFFCDKSCVKCGSTDRLELDHIDRSTKVDSHIWSWSAARREVELAKCQVLCYDCHKKKTKADLYVDKCGTHHGYTKGCRCGACKQAHAEYNKQWRSRVGMQMAEAR